MPVGQAFRRDIMRSLRMIYAFGVDAKLVTTNPARKLKAPAQIRSKKILPFETWAEVERVAAECGRWGPIGLVYGRHRRQARGGRQAGAQAR